MRNFGQNTKTLNLAKVGLAKVGHDQAPPQRVEPTIYSSDDNDPLVPVLADSTSTVPASVGALREAGVEISEFSRNVVPSAHDQADSGGRLTGSDPHTSNGATHRFFSGCAVRNVTRRVRPTVGFGQ